MPKTVKAAISIILVVIAVLIAKVLIATAPKAERKLPPKMAPLVETKTLQAADETVYLQLTGTVIPAEEVKLRARVSGEIVSLSPDFIDGGRPAKGSELVKIDPVDYELALAQAESALEKARFDYKIELGRQDVARREWELLKPDGDVSELEKELALRSPHLKASRAALQAARSNLRKVKLDLERTRIKAPFNAVVLNRNVNVGSQAAQQDVLATLVGTDVYWIQVSIPVDRLGWVHIPGSTVDVSSASGAVRQGTVIKLLGNLEEKGRMARLLVEVNDPLTGKNPLLLGEYVRVRIAGRSLENVFSIPRSALRENSEVWFATKEDKLDIRRIDVLWRDAERAIVRDGLSNGDRLIVSDLTAPIDGMDINPGEQTDHKDPDPETSP